MEEHGITFPVNHSSFPFPLPLHYLGSSWPLTQTTECIFLLNSYSQASALPQSSPNSPRAFILRGHKVITLSSATCSKPLAQQRKLHVIPSLSASGHLTLTPCQSSSLDYTHVALGVYFQSLTYAVLTYPSIPLANSYKSSEIQLKHHLLL